MSKKLPKIIKDTIYLEWSKPKNYKDLVIKKNNVTKDLEQIYNNNIWNLKDQSAELSKKIEYKGIYNAVISGEYLLHYKLKPQITSVGRKELFNYKFKGNNTELTELNYIHGYKAWINNIFPEHSSDTNLDWFILNRNEVL